MTYPPIRWLCWTLLALGLAACQSTPPSTTMPAGFDLSGAWELVPGESDVLPSMLNLRARGGLLHLIAQDFPVLRARRMTIDQGHDSMGLTYDGADYRDVSWGTRKRGLWEVQAGWLEGRLVIISKAEDADALETFTLSPDGKRLTVEIEIRSSGESLQLRRTYARL
jgi:hypothetical protein